MNKKLLDHNLLWFVIVILLMIFLVYMVLQ